VGHQHRDYLPADRRQRARDRRQRRLREPQLRPAGRRRAPLPLIGGLVAGYRVRDPAPALIAASVLAVGLAALTFVLGQAIEPFVPADLSELGIVLATGAVLAYSFTLAVVGALLGGLVRRAL
jgi:hypothetical protein